MASSNRHWPSMFKSKPCNHHQWQHEINSSLISTGCHRSPYSSVTGCEERSPEPKPRWNPKPEQIQILEAIFNSGLVNPPREEIRKIRAQLQEYGQVGDANVFYWFQNRKSRSKHKQRHLQNNNPKTQNKTHPNSTATASASVTAPTSSSSSDKSSSKPYPNIGPTNVVDVSNNSPTASVNQQHHAYFNAAGEFLPEGLYYPVQQQTLGGGVFGFPEMSNVVNVSGGGDQTVRNCSGVLLTELMMMNNNNNNNIKKGGNFENEKMKVVEEQQQDMCSYTLVTTNANAAAAANTIIPTTIPSTVTNIGVCEGSGVGDLTPARSTVFINDVAFEVTVGPFNVREAFGDDAVLIHSSGHPVVTNEWGVTHQSLQHGAFYYLVRTLATPHGYTFDLI